MEEVTVHKAPEGLTISGNVNFHTVVCLRQLGNDFIASEEAPRIDFKAVEQCDSTGLALMMAWLRQAKKENKPIEFLNVPSSLKAIAGVCDVSEILGISSQ